MVDVVVLGEDDVEVAVELELEGAAEEDVVSPTSISPDAQPTNGRKSKAAKPVFSFMNWDYKRCSPA